MLYDQKDDPCIYIIKLLAKVMLNWRILCVLRIDGNKINAFYIVFHRSFNDTYMFVMDESLFVCIYILPCIIVP